MCLFFGCKAGSKGVGVFVFHCFFFSFSVVFFGFCFFFFSCLFLRGREPTVHLFFFGFFFGGGGGGVRSARLTAEFSQQTAPRLLPRAVWEPSGDRCLGLAPRT